ALDQVGGQGSAGNHQERVVLPRGVLVDEAGQVGLARPRLAGEQHGHVVGGGPRQALRHWHQRRQLPQQFAAPPLRRGLRRLGCRPPFPRAGVIPEEADWVACVHSVLPPRGSWRRLAVAYFSSREWRESPARNFRNGEPGLPQGENTRRIRTMLALL